MRKYLATSTLSLHVIIKQIVKLYDSRYLNDEDSSSKKLQFWQKVNKTPVVDKNNITDTLSPNHVDIKK